MFQSPNCDCSFTLQRTWGVKRTKRHAGWKICLEIWRILRFSTCLCVSRVLRIPCEKVFHQKPTPKPLGEGIGAKGRNNNDKCISKPLARFWTILGNIYILSNDKLDACPSTFLYQKKTCPLAKHIPASSDSNQLLTHAVHVLHIYLHLP